MGLLDGQVAIITGAGGGLGRAYSLLLASEGAAVLVNDMNAEAAQRVVAEVLAAGGRAAACISDVTTPEAGEAILQAAQQAFGGVDILVNNAGILRDKSFANLAEEHWDAVLRVHLKGAFCVTQAVFRAMKAQGRGGVIVNTASSSGLGGAFGQTNYGAAKAGVWGFSNCLALEGQKYGIRVWTLCPAAATPMTQGLMTPEMVANWSPERVAPVLLYMVSALSGTLTNKTLFASGSKVMELKMVSGPALPNRPGLTARDLADAAEALFLPDAPLDFNG
ncbi:SDR family NAD(P)-dependent oxidoreductase [Aquabacterium sp.]|uniref:SDR family NAD(P)-dependent oxidoreductase n=1 Tax=Aquabacterium sp. TaxID=1872578 RepID=UPI002C04316C|nr:SDR family NAD(P)-dependent oxidoreductase [Aquabacterium sp.]HSW04937.1 SDR family NAD(P)-dependent oxidoreductase [Aquabacterium sp.]